ncbi:hypothetical protein CICLE_v10026890mg [Citrus x clementina]|uniref:Uncharacterized protein n=2 Tax=Citrus TaxID=2706 RepID=V4SMF9_CITCL|nr:hypothetical protein CICLE_v10026890mg [Citrus x clementina]GAY33298.1 hypothetical protein CUMW_274890 [Citrus unshiu]
MAGNNPRCMLLTLFIFVIVLSPTLPCKEAARLTAANGLSGVQRAPFAPTIVCPLCVRCCEPAPPGRCCKCGC